MQLYDSQPVGTVVRCQANINFKNGDTSIPVQISSISTITDRQFDHLYFDSKITYSIANATKPYMTVSVSVDEKIEEEKRKIRTELDRSSIHVDYPGNPEMGSRMHRMLQEQYISYMNYTDITVNQSSEYIVRLFDPSFSSGVMIQSCAPESVK